MAASIDPTGFVFDFLKRVGLNLEAYPAPFDYAAFESNDPPIKLPIGLLGKLSQLRETEGELTARFAREHGILKQRCISRNVYNTSVYDSEKHQLDFKEEKERSEARE